MVQTVPINKSEIRSGSPTTNNPLLLKRLEELKQKRVMKGYEIIEFPNPADLPRPLTGLTIDMLAIGRERVLAVVLRDRQSAKNDESLMDIAAALSRIPQWFADFHMVSDAPEEND